MEEVIIISENIQEFLGERFYKCGYYFQHNGKRLHRCVWEHFNGEIKKGFHIHHKDGNRCNNNIDNLEMIEGKKHILEHARSESRRENGRQAIKKAIEKAPEWHHSEEGKEWHSKHAKEVWDNIQPIEYECTFCGAKYLSKSFRHSGNHFCCNNHKSAYRRKMLKAQ